MLASCHFRRYPAPHTEYLIPNSLTSASMVLTRPINICDGPPAFPQSHSFYLHSSCLYFVEASTTELSRRLREHSASASIPSGAFAPFSTLHLNLGISMSLPTPYRFAKAKRLLGSLDLTSLTRELSKPSLESAQLGKDSQGSRGHCHSLQQPP